MARRRARREAERRAEQQRLQAVEEQRRGIAQKAFEMFRDAQSLADLPDMGSQISGLILQAGERCCAVVPNAGLVRTHRHTTYSGASQGVSIRIMKGVSYRVGQFHGQPQTTMSEEIDDQGSLVVTSKRIVFVGQREVVSIAANKIADVRVDGSRVVALAENRKTPLIVILGNPYAAPVMAMAAHRMAEFVASPKA